jgi:mono/diheme cytochrome c family protein
VVCVLAGLLLALTARVLAALTAEAAVSPVHEGWRRYQGVCGHCHGPDGAGSSFAPSLVDPLPPRDRFDVAVLRGVSGTRGVMRGFAGDPNVEPYLDAIYAYLEARASGRLGRGRPDGGP